MQKFHHSVPPSRALPLPLFSKKKVFDFLGVYYLTIKLFTGYPQKLSTGGNFMIEFPLREGKDREKSRSFATL
jgi:hypothetical protein